ncbi:DUF2164 domain-containing protein [Candidatus Falkowbacteria bacterium CG10_big_fil_rev_8_21_14_0_10_39_11]|uniref:DUF2164 domain-containing protein n=1 Tax=Candidatus Falkowbacteria bacterium CG10_big_fil_rev_8_21_14_0_10_39_11 TaxID=1974565 RepID=A0A2H0V6B7_9BACT|nr:MAG: DUF2164 domain-containing protein [Candidatus Falkowbacteria bacterium CG10_big_fil_rev_8_21_14_0_10_39_11]
MKKTKRKWDVLSKDRRRTCINEIITFFYKSRDEEIGMIAAEEILDYFLEHISGHVYNRAIRDCQELLKKRFDDFELDLDLLINK